MDLTTITLHPDFTIADVPPELFGGFIEHMGRGVYGGLFEPGPLSDSRGYRQDVIELIRKLGVTTVRYPGGNFVSGYDWLAGVGPLAKRNKVLDLAWKTVETNRFGTDEFLQWSQDAGVAPVLAVNLGTKGIADAIALFEYVNGQPGTTWADLRVANGHPSPYGVRYWCLGNEMDGPWQVGQKSPTEYAGIAREVAKALKLLDPTVKLIACGSSNERMATFGEWERVVLEASYDFVDFISLHAYYEPDAGDPAVYLESGHSMDRFIKGVVATADAVAARRRSNRKIDLAFDEWNIFDPRRFGPAPDHWVPAGSPISEGTFDWQDAVVVADLLTTLVNNCDRVRMAALAQLVNGIAPIMTSKDSAWTQAIYLPFATMATLVSGTALQVAKKESGIPSRRFGEIPSTNVAVTRDVSRGRLSVSCVNRSLLNPRSVVINWGGKSPLRAHRVECAISGTHGIVDMPVDCTETSATLQLPPNSWMFAVLETEGALDA